eukprot:5882259-Pleurochrysis_carterae.AAC.1
MRSWRQSPLPYSQAAQSAVPRVAEVRSGSALAAIRSETHWSLPRATAAQSAVRPSFAAQLTSARARRSACAHSCMPPSQAA